MSKHCRLSRGRLALLVAAVALTAACSVSISDQNQSGSNGPAISISSDYNVSFRDFNASYLRGAESGRYNSGQGFPAPSLWLFSPKGELVSLSTDAQQLKALIQDFPPASSDVALPDQLDFSALTKIYSDAKGKAGPSIRPEKWNAVLFYTNSSQCELCVTYVRGMHDLVQAHGAEINDIAILLTE